MASTIPKPHQTRPTASVCGPEMARLRVMSRSAPVVAGSSVGSLGAAATIRYSTRYCLMWLHIAQHGTTGMQVPRVHVLYRFENRASPVPEVFNVAHIQEGHKFINRCGCLQSSNQTSILITTRGG